MNQKPSSDFAKKSLKSVEIQDKFEKMVLKRIGELLISEIEDKIQKNCEESLERGEISLTLRLLPSLRNYIDIFNENNVLVDLAFLYVLYCLNKLPFAWKMKYSEKLQEIRKIWTSNMHKLGLQTEFHDRTGPISTQITISKDLYEKITPYKEKLNEFFIFGVLSILDWMGVLDNEFLPEFQKLREFVLKFIA